MKTDPYRLPLTSLQRRLLHASQRYGATAVVVGITGFAVLTSVLITLLSLIGQPLDGIFAKTAIALAVFIPLGVAPISSIGIVQLVRVVAEAHARLQLLASTDSLTGIANRRQFFEAAPDLLANADCQVLVGMVDLDQFKQVNDVYGHAMGDATLIALARRLQHAAGTNGLVARLGGDEFGLLVPVGADSRPVIEDALRNACRDVTVSPPVSVTASIGIEVVMPDVPLNEAMMRADQSLYRAKPVHRRVEGKVRVLRTTAR